MDVLWFVFSMYWKEMVKKKRRKDSGSGGQSGTLSATGQDGREISRFEPLPE
jgi:hypothetical protein